MSTARSKAPGKAKSTKPKVKAQAAKKPSAKKAAPKVAAKTVKKPAAVAKKAAVKKPVKPTRAAVEAAALKAAEKIHHGPLHYNKNALLKEYLNTYGHMMAITGVFVVTVLLYFFGLLVFIGRDGVGHAGDFVKHFGSRVDMSQEYTGLKLPEFQNKN